MIKTQKRWRLGALFFTGLLVFSQLAILVGSYETAHAQTSSATGPTGPAGLAGAVGAIPYDQDSVTEKAINWVLARAVEECLDSNGVQGKDDPNSIMKGDITAGEYVGRLVEGTSSNDGQVDCDPIWKAAHQSLGWNAADTVCTAFKFERDHGTCLEGSGGYHPGSSKVNYGDAWNDYFRNAYLGGKTLTASLTNGMRYFIYLGDFKEKCGNDQGASGFTVFDWNKQSTSKDSDYDLQWYSGGEITEKYVVADKDTKPWDVHISGYKMLDNKGDNNDIISCRDLASNINKYAPDAIKELAADKAANRDQVTADSSATNADNSGGSCFSWKNPISWLICPGVALLSEMVVGLDHLVENQLTLDDSTFNNEAVKQLWQVMRDIAFLILVPMMLLMVIGTALEFGPFDAYTVKKALPRMLLAVMFIPLSLSICFFLVRVSNIVGHDIGNIILGAGDRAGIHVDHLYNLFNFGSTAALTLTTGGAVAGGAVTETLTAPIIGSMALTAVAGLLIAYFTLILRQLLIVVMIFVAPLAILVWIFPGNDKLWKVWRTTFIAMLMMFPLVMLLIYSGKLMAGVVDQAVKGPAEFIFKTVVYVGPFFFIPATFKAGMGAFNALTGAINDRSRGFFDGQRKRRQAARQQGIEGFFAGQNNRNFLSRRAQGVGSDMGAFLNSRNKLGLLSDAVRGRGRDGNARWDTARATWGSQVTARYGKAPNTEASRENDDQSWAQTYATEQEARAGLTTRWNDAARVERAVAAARNNGGFSAANANFAARQLARTGTGYANNADLHEVVNRVAGDNEAMAADLLGEINATTKQAQRNDLAAGYNVHMAAYRNSRARVAAGGTADLTVEENRDLHMQAARDMDAVTMIRMKAGGLTNTSEALRESFDLAQATAADPTVPAAARQAARVEAARLTGLIGKVEQAGSYGSTTNVDIVGDVVVDPTSGRGNTMTVMGPNGNPINVPVPNSGRQAVIADAGRVQTKVDEVTGKLEVIYDLDTSTGSGTTPSPRGTPANPGGPPPGGPAGGGAGGPRRALTDEDEQKPIVVDNPTFDQDVGDMYHRHSPQGRGNDPNDPNL